MENFELIVSLAGAALGLFITTATFLAKFVKNAKLKKAAEQTIEICNAILPYIEEAETFVNYSGEEKKAYVMTKVNQYAIENGISFDKELVDNEIEEMVKLSKEVNSREKDKQSISKVITIPAR